MSKLSTHVHLSNPYQPKIQTKWRLAGRIDLVNRHLKPIDRRVYDTISTAKGEDGLQPDLPDMSIRHVGSTVLLSGRHADCCLVTADRPA